MNYTTRLWSNIKKIYIVQSGNQPTNQHLWWTSFIASMELGAFKITTLLATLSYSLRVLASSLHPVRTEQKSYCFSFSLENE